MSVWGMPGPGGSLGKCAVCGGDFASGTIKSLMGIDSGIQSFRVGFVDQELFAHAPECVDKIKTAFSTDDPRKVLDALPEGPLKDCLESALNKRNAA